MRKADNFASEGKVMPRTVYASSSSGTEPFLLYLEKAAHVQSFFCRYGHLRRTKIVLSLARVAHRAT